MQQLLDAVPKVLELGGGGFAAAAVVVAQFDRGFNLVEDALTAVGERVKALGGEIELPGNVAQDHERKDAAEQNEDHRRKL